MSGPQTAPPPIGVYIHVPFCARKCPYCDFYSVPYTAQSADSYTEALLRAIEGQPFGPQKADTLYFGGGTPVLLGQNRLRRIVSAAVHAFGMDPAAGEITVEANPAAAMKTELAGLRQAGFERVSFGVQSLQDSELSALGRLHGAETARQAVRDAAAVGFENISADLMLAVPGQTADSLSRTIDEMANLPLTHISAYLLKVEPGTPFHRQEQQSALHLPDEDATAELYLDAVRRLAGHGFVQYEISNFARDGNVSRHNLKYWRCEPYLGIGPGAHSFLTGRRFFFPRELDCFSQAKQPFALVKDDGEGGGAQEALLLGLRLTEGVDLQALSLSDRAIKSIRAKAELFARGGLATLQGHRIALTPAGFLLSNSIISALLAEF